ncbi:MAG: hypothetical protein RIC35_10765 [Marinoscillum sp.]
MTDDEFEVLDELYFVTPFEQLLEETNMDSIKLVQILNSIYLKGWVKIMETVDDEVPKEKLDLENKAGSYFFLATKEGLLAHNS